MDVLKILIAFAALLGLSSADCSVRGLQCCLTEFLMLVSPAGISLQEKKAAAACTTKDDSLRCLLDYDDQCVSLSEGNLRESINATGLYLNAICPPASSFMANVSRHQECLLNASMAFQSCYNRTLPPPTTADDEKAKWKAACCDYKTLRDCAASTVKTSCGAEASQLVQQEVTSVNGLGFESACESLFAECSSGSTVPGTLVSSLSYLVGLVLLLSSVHKFQLFL